MRSSWLLENRSGHFAREERRVLLVCAALIVACYGIDVLSATRAHGLLFALRALWGAVVAFLGFIHPRLSISGRRFGLLFASASAPSFLMAIAAIGSPVPNPLFYWAVTFPLIIAVVVRGDLLLVVVNCATTIASAFVVLVAVGEPLSAAAVFSLLCLVTGTLAIFGSLHIHRIAAAEQQAHADRIAALEKLAHSERRRADAERMALLGQLSAGVAHEIANPLAFTLAGVRFALMPGAQHGDREGALGDAVMGLERIEGIVRDLKRFARRDEQEGRIEERDVRTIVADAARLASFRLKNIAQVNTVMPEGPLVVRTDGRRVCQVLVNLLVNAADALEESGRRPARVTVRAALVGNDVSLVVEDNGPGIPPEVLPRIFEPFFTTKPEGKGTGLGLALSREYVARLGGTITASNAPAGGARFELRLPMRSEALESDEGSSRDDVAA